MPDKRVPRVLVAAVAFAALTAACSSGRQRASLSGGVDAFGESHTPDTESPTTTAALSVESIVISADGLGALSFGHQAAQALKGLTQALGRAESWRSVTVPADCGATRVFTWKNFDVLVNEASASSATTPGLVGWNLRDGGPASLDLATANGVRIGSTVAALKGAYGGNVSLGQTEEGPTATITTGNGVITAQLDGLGNASTIRSLRAGAICRE